MVGAWEKVREDTSWKRWVDRLISKAELQEQMNVMNNHQVNFRCQVIQKIAKARTRSWTKQESRIKVWIRLDWKKSCFKFRDWNQDLNQREGLEPKLNEVQCEMESRLEMNWTLYPRWSFTYAKRRKLKIIYSVPAKVIHSCQAEDIQGHLPMPSGRSWRSFTLYPQR